MNKKLNEMMNEQGFLPDNDLLDFAEEVIKECIKVIQLNNRCPNGYIGSHDAGFQLGCNLSIENIKKHFGIK